MDTLIKIKLQQGFALFMTLVTLIIITISGISMMRLMQAGTSAAGNIAFRQASVGVASFAAEDATTFLASSNQSKAVLGVTSSPYYANANTAFDPVAYDWDGSNKSFIMPARAGYNINYVIHRLAMRDGLCEGVPGSGCVYSAAASTAGTAEGSSFTASAHASPAVDLVYYRITVRVSGPRHNVTYMQTLMY